MSLPSWGGAWAKSLPEPDPRLEQVLCFKHRWRVARDNTVKFQKRTLQLLPSLEGPCHAGAQLVALQGHEAVAAHGYRGHIRRKGEEKLDAQGEKRYPARRWVVERAMAWLSKCRAILVRYGKKASNYLGLIKLAYALIWYRRQGQLRVSK